MKDPSYAYIQRMQYLHRLEKANRGNQKSALKVLEEVYGRKGKTRHGLLYVGIRDFIRLQSMLMALIALFACPSTSKQKSE